MGAIQAGMGIAQTAIAASKASKLPQDQKYTASPEFQAAFNELKARKNQGLSPAELAASDQAIARQGTAAKRMFQNVGLSGAGAAAAGIMQGDTLNQRAAMAAQLERQNFGQYVSGSRAMQSIQDQETNRFNTQLNMKRQALGGAMQSGLSNVMSGINTGVNAQQMSNTLNQPNENPYIGGEMPTWFDNQATSIGGQPTSNVMQGQMQQPFGQGPSTNQSFGLGQNSYGFGTPTPQNNTGLGVYDFNQGNSNFYQFGG